jgi:hypothetical protein
MQTEHETKYNVGLTAAEVSNLWNSYMNDSMAKCVLKHFLSKVEDIEVRPLIQYALELAQNHVHTVTEILKNEKHPIPHGFTDEDLDAAAPRLFTDIFFLLYLHNMSSNGLKAYSLALSLVTRPDIVEFYSECLASSKELNVRASQIMLSKGIYSRSPFIPTPEKVEFIAKQSYLEGLFEGTRPLDAVEITNIYSCLLSNILGKVLLTGFCQVAESQKVREYMYRGIKIAVKHIETFGSLLKKDNLPSLRTWDSEVTVSKVPPFSDKLMMFHTRILSSAGIANYGVSMSTSMRHDLGVNYGRLMAEFGHYGDDGLNLMINNKWLEQPPLAADRKELANI